MNLQDALKHVENGYSIRTPEMGYQMLFPDGIAANGDLIFKITGSFDQKIGFTDFEKARTDWEVVGLDSSSQKTPLSPGIEADFDEIPQFSSPISEEPNVIDEVTGETDEDSGETDEYPGETSEIS